MKNLFIFTISSIIAGVVGYKVGYSKCKKHYDGLADAEIAVVKEALEKHYEKRISELKKNSIGTVKDTVAPTQKIKRPMNTKAIDEITVGTDYGKQYRTQTEPDRIPGVPGNDIKHLKKEELDTTKPYVISPEEFHDSEYECVTLYYFADKVLTDEDHNQLNNIGIIGGYPILDQMGIYDSDCLYVRSEKTGIDYEILLEERMFSNIRPLGVH